MTDPLIQIFFMKVNKLNQYQADDLYKFEINTSQYNKITPKVANIASQTMQ